MPGFRVLVSVRPVGYALVFLPGIFRDLRRWDIGKDGPPAQHEALWLTLGCRWPRR